MTGDSKDERLFLFEPWCGCCLQGLSTGSVFARTSGLGPREKFCVPSNCAALEGWDVGNKVKLDRAGDVARR